MYGVITVSDMRLELCAADCQVLHVVCREGPAVHQQECLHCGRCQRNRLLHQRWQSNQVACQQRLASGGSEYYGGCSRLVSHTVAASGSRHCCYCTRQRWHDACLLLSLTLSGHDMPFTHALQTCPMPSDCSVYKQTKHPRSATGSWPLLKACLSVQCWGCACRLPITPSVKMLIQKVLLYRLGKIAITAACGLLAFGLSDLSYYTDPVGHADSYLSSPLMPVLVSVLVGYTISNVFLQVLHACCLPACLSSSTYCCYTGAACCFALCCYDG